MIVRRAALPAPYATTGLAALASVAVLSAAATPAGAQDVRIKASAEAEATFSDNIGGVGAGGRSQGDFIVSPSGRVQASVDTGRSTAAATYNLAYDQYTFNHERSGIRQSFIGVGAYQAWEDRLTLDARASLSQIFDGIGLGAATERAGVSNTTQTFAYSLGPTFRQPIGGFAELETSYRFGGTIFFEDYDGSDDDGGLQPDDRIRHEAEARLSSGRDFDRLRWTLSGRYVDETGGETDTGPQFTDALGQPLFAPDDAGTGLTSLTAVADLEYRITRTIGLLASYGYDDIDLEGGRPEELAGEELSGAFWTVGLRLNPSPRTDISVQHGRRYDEPFWSGSLTWRPTRRTTFAGSYQTQVTSQQDTFIDDLENLILIETPVGQLACNAVLLTCGPLESVTSLVDSTFRSQRLSLSARHERETWTYTLTGEYVKRDFVTSGEQDTTYSASLQVDQQLRPNTTASGRISYTRSDGLEVLEQDAGPGVLTPDETSVIGISLSLSHQFATDLEGSLGYTHLRRSSDDGGTRKENALVGRIAVTF